ncbi:MAG: hypothetical protein ACK4UN_20665, partial [Limisphaerales bacterium]
MKNLFSRLGICFCLAIAFAATSEAKIINPVTTRSKPLRARNRGARRDRATMSAKIIRAST